MTREDGFEIADTDTGMLADPKVLTLARRLHDSTRTLAAVGLYDAVRLASWKAGRRLTLAETTPGWCLDPVDDLAAHLVAVGLLDSEQKLPEHAWAGWYGPAHERREAKRTGGRISGYISHGMTPELARAKAVQPLPQLSPGIAGSVLDPSDPSIPTGPSGPTTDDDPSKEDHDELRREREQQAAYDLARRTGRLPTPADPRPLAAILADLATTTTTTGATTP
jgi:hypothetical protein